MVGIDTSVVLVFQHRTAGDQLPTLEDPDLGWIVLGLDDLVGALPA